MTAVHMTWFLPISLVAISSYYFYLGCELSIWKRVASSAHGMFVFLIPAAGLILDERLLERESNFAGVGFLSMFLAALVSVAASMRFLRVKWRVHILHFITIGGLYLSTFMTGLAVLDGLG